MCALHRFCGVLPPCHHIQFRVGVAAQQVCSLSGGLGCFFLVKPIRWPTFAKREICIYIYANLKVLRPYSLLFSRRCEDVSKGRFSSSVPPVSMQAKHILNSNNICSEYVCNSNCSHRSEIWQHPCSICSWFSTSKSVIAIPLWNAFPNKSLKRPETPW